MNSSSSQSSSQSSKRQWNNERGEQKAKQATSSRANNIAPPPHTNWQKKKEREERELREEGEKEKEKKKESVEADDCEMQRCEERVSPPSPTHTHVQNQWYQVPNQQDDDNNKVEEKERRKIIRYKRACLPLSLPPTFSFIYFFFICINTIQTRMPAAFSSSIFHFWFFIFLWFFNQYDTNAHGCRFYFLLLFHLFVFDLSVSIRYKRACLPLLLPNTFSIHLSLFVFHSVSQLILTLSFFSSLTI